jgi:holin-like protein
MEIIYQLGIILVITFIGELLHGLIPLPIPASIYGLLLMLLCLKIKIVKLENVKQVGDFLLEIMPLMFIPAAVGLITIWNQMSNILIPVVVITLLSTIVVMVATGGMTEIILKRLKGKEK